MDQAYQVSKCYENCYCIQEGGVRCFLFCGTEKALLLDTGFGTGDLKSVVESITALPVLLVNTHSDRDHIGCNRQFGTAYMHPAEFDRYQQNMEGAPAAPLWEGDVLELGGFDLRVILIPGHTPGGIALLDEKNRSLFAGDMVLKGGEIFMFGPGRNMLAYLASMQKLMTMSERFDTVYGCHHDLPVDKEVLPLLAQGAEDYMEGRLTGRKVDMHGNPVMLYDFGAAKFLCE